MKTQFTRKSDTALIIINYGTPRSTSRRDVARYLRELLGNNHVMTMNAIGRSILVNCIIAPFRASHSAKLYAQMCGNNNEMPLKKHTNDFATKLQQQIGSNADVHIAMTSGFSYIKDVISQILDAGYHRIVAAPMFPQYTESTWGKALDDLFSALKGRLNLPSINVIEPFYNDPYYIDSMCKETLTTIDHLSEYERFVFSYHGIPLSHTLLAHPGHTCNELGCSHQINTQNARCYLAQCHLQTKLMAQHLGIDPKICITTFQSRLSERWITPFTDTTVRELAASGIKNIAVLTPSFTVDCLETLVEIDSTMRKTFITSGGQKFTTIPCLNAQDHWVKNFYKIIEKTLQ